MINPETMKRVEIDRLRRHTYKKYEKEDTDLADMLSKIIGEILNNLNSYEENTIFENYISRESNKVIVETPNLNQNIEGLAKEALKREVFSVIKSNTISFKRCLVIEFLKSKGYLCVQGNLVDKLADCVEDDVWRDKEGDFEEVLKKLDYSVESCGKKE